MYDVTFELGIHSQICSSSHICTVCVTLCGVAANGCPSDGGGVAIIVRIGPITMAKLFVDATISVSHAQSSYIL